MENSIRELIESATIKGNITESERTYIIKKAGEIGIDEIEVNIFINANIQKNSFDKTKQNDSLVPNYNEGWLKFNKFKLGNWIVFTAIIVLFISGFLPWVKSNVSSSGMGQSYGGSASIGGGFFYTLPLSISAIYFAMKISLFKFRVFFGPFIILVAIGLAASYSSKSGGSFGGISASASTGAGPGVFFLGLSGLIYLVGCLILADSKSKLRSLFTHEYAILVYFLFLIIVPATFDDFSFGFWPSVFTALFWAGLPLLLAIKKDFNKTKNVLIGNLAFWLLVIIIPIYSNSSFLNFARESFDSLSTYYICFFTTICLVALLLDYFFSKGKTIDLFKKSDLIFKPFFMVLVIAIPFVCLTLFSALTKHKVSFEELDAFNKKNTNFQGYWYFLNADSTKVNRFNIYSSAIISSDKSGDIDLVLTAQFDEDNTVKMKKYDSEIKMKEGYDFEIKYPIVFENVFEISSSNNNILKAVIYSSSGEKINLTAVRESNVFEEAIRKKQEKIQLLMNQGTYKVIVDKCNLYYSPGYGSELENYLVNGQNGTFTKFVDGFVFTSFLNENGLTIEGWILASDIEIYH